MTEAETIRSFEDALAGCGASAQTLSAAERRALDEAGFVVFASGASAGDLARLRRAFEFGAGVLEPPSRAEKPKATGTRHVGDLGGEDGIFGEVAADPRVLAAAFHALARPFRLFQLSGRDPLPGWGRQGLHTDWLPRDAQEPCAIVTALWILDAFEAANGATRLIPGSHRLARPLPKSMQAPESRHPDEIVVLAPAGSVLVFNGHLWHGGTRNETRLPRRVLQIQYLAQDRVRPAGASGAPATRALPDRARFLAQVQTRSSAE